MRCLVCEGEARIWGQFEKIPILECCDNRCGFKFFELSKWESPYTDTDYYAAEELGSIKPSAPWIRARVRILERLKNRGKIAELGCGIGETAIALANAGYEVVGVEESARATSFLRQNFPSVDWRNDNILTFLEKNKQSFDAISMFHVLEHIPYPKRVIELVDASLHHDGIIIIEVPDARGGLARLKGIRWDYYMAHHVNYFDPKSLGRLLEQFGYRRVFLEKTYHFSFPQGNALKDLVKGVLARSGLNSIIRTAWKK